MMDNGLGRLRKTARDILDPEKELADLIPAASALRDLFEHRTHFRADDGRDVGAGQTRLASGLAISPTLAAMCIRELSRTLAFIRGLHQAIGDAMQTGNTVRVLYAGCGPYALLVLPLMTIFSSEQVKFVLLDIHRESLGRALALIDSFGLARGIEDALCTDATQYQIPPDQTPNIIVSETMAVCLHNEPQVAIARNLLSQAPGATMVPESVSVELGLLDYAKEHVLMPADHTGSIPDPERDRIHLGKIFELDSASIHHWHGTDGDRLPAGRAQIPAPLEARYRPHLLTKIRVYGETRLQDYDCSLTIPQPLRGRPVFAGGETLQFHYRLGAYPELRYQVLG